MKDRRIENMVARLIEETSRENMVWRIGNAPSSLTKGTDHIIGIYFHGDFKNMHFALYEVRYKYFHDEEDFHWSSSNVLAVLDLQDRVVWEVSDVPEINELFADVSRKASGIDELLDYFR